MVRAHFEFQFNDNVIDIGDTDILTLQPERSINLGTGPLASVRIGLALPKACPLDLSITYKNGRGVIFSSP